MHWLALTLLCAFFLASADAAVKWYLSDYRAADLVVVRLVWTAVLLLPLLFRGPFPSLPPIFWGDMALLVPAELVALWLYMQALRISPLSHSLPYLALTPVFNVVTARLLLGERTAPLALLGVAAVAAGIYLLNIGQIGAGGRRRWLEPFRFMFREPGPRLMATVAFLYSLTSPLSKAALQYAPASFFGPFYYALLGAAAFAAAAARAPLQASRLLWRRPAAHLLVGAAMAAMVIFHFLALERVQVAYMIAVKRSSLLFGILYGIVLFREKHPLQHLGAGAVMVAGILLIAMA